MRASSGPSTYELPEVQRYGSRACFGLRKLSNRCFHRSASDRSALRGCRKLFSSPCGSGASHRCVHRVEWVAIAKFTRALGSSFAPELSAASGPWSAHERCSRFTTVPAGSFEFARRALPASSSRLGRRYASGRAACRSSCARAKAHSPTHERVQVIERRDGMSLELNGTVVAGGGHDRAGGRFAGRARRQCSSITACCASRTSCQHFGA